MMLVLLVNTAFQYSIHLWSENIYPQLSLILLDSYVPFFVNILGILYFYIIYVYCT